MTAIKFGTDGWRSVIAEDHPSQDVRKIAQAIARYVVRAEAPERGIVVGYDAGLGSDNFARLAAETVSAAGIPVWLASESGPSPALSLLVRLRGAAGGIQITASRHRLGWNEIQFKARYGGCASPAIVAQIESELKRVLREGLPPLPSRKDLIHSLGVREPYLETLGGLVDWDRLRTSKFRYVIDPLQGAGPCLLRELFHRHGVVLDEVGSDHDPAFGGANPQPLEPPVEALRQAVRTGHYDAGFALDGDAERFGAIDRQGHFITPQQIFSILLWHLAGTRKLAGEVAKTFSTTKMIDKIAAKFGRKVWETPIGFKYICNRMLEGDILLGGEESGGIATKLHLPEPDATVNALLLAEVMAWHGKHLGELVSMLQQDFGEHHYGRVDLRLQDGQAERAVQHFAGPQMKRLLGWPVGRREDLDGLKLYLGDIGWVLVRVSGTEHMLSIYSETTSPETTRRLLDEVSTLVRAL